MSNLTSILSDEGQAPADEPVIVEAVEPEQHAEPAAEATGEPAAPPAEQQETNDSAKGLQAALLAERRRRQELEAQLRQQQPKPAEGAPDPAAYQDNPQEYWRLLARHEAREELKATIEQAHQQKQAEKEQERINATMDRLNAAVAIGQGKHKDFDAVINGGLAPFLTDALREELAESDNCDELAYWLGKNPAEAQRISTLSPRALAREVVKLEAKALAPPKPAIPQTLTQVRDSRGQYANTAAYDGPTPLDAVLGRKT